MNLRILPDARDELEAAAAYYEAQRLGLGLEFLEEYSLGLEQVADQPRRFPMDDFSRTGWEFRYALLGRFPYRVVFRILDQELVVIAVAHTRRMPGYWRKRRGQSS